MLFALRNLKQLSLLRDVFLNSKNIYCFFHLARPILPYFELSDLGLHAQNVCLTRFAAAQSAFAAVILCTNCQHLSINFQYFGANFECFYGNELFVSFYFCCMRQCIISYSI